VANKLRIVVFILLSITSAQLTAAQTESSQISSAPVPAQIETAKRVFISNAGEENGFHLATSNYFAGGPNRPYNQFYATIKAWGHYEIANAPADADLIFEIGLKYLAQPSESRFQLNILDPRTGVRLWTLNQDVQPAGLPKNREKNYNAAMDALFQALKNLVSGTASPSSPK